VSKNRDIVLHRNICFLHQILHRYFFLHQFYFTPKSLFFTPFFCYFLHQNVCFFATNFEILKNKFEKKIGAKKFGVKISAKR